MTATSGLIGLIDAEPRDEAGASGAGALHTARVASGPAGRVRYCAALTNNGRPCRQTVPLDSSTGLCIHHGDPERAGQLRQLGAYHAAESREAARQAALAVELPQFTDVGAVQTALERLAHAAAGGRHSPMSLSAGVRACEAWLKAAEMERDRKQLAALERQVRDLRAALARTAKGNR